MEVAIHMDTHHCLHREIIHAEYETDGRSSLIIRAYAKKSRRIIGQVKLYALEEIGIMVPVEIQFDPDKFPEVRKIQDVELVTCHLSGNVTQPFVGRIFDLESNLSKN